ncbi:MAG: hypothetical protein ACD_75C00840G0002 [uncultured bacterium]|nr:MAG: hypothetical protein ACD_75C00840G0002 [uncultured bacterium]
MLPAGRFAGCGHLAEDRKRLRIIPAVIRDNLADSFADHIGQAGTPGEGRIDRDILKIDRHAVLIDHSAVGDGIEHVLKQRPVGLLAFPEHRLRLPPGGIVANDQHFAEEDAAFPSDSGPRFVDGNLPAVVRAQHH